MIDQEQSDIRWKQRFRSFQQANKQLADAIALGKQRSLSKLEQQGLIKAFEFTQELAWKVMKDYLEYQGNTSITGSRDALREAFRSGLLEDGDGWMDTIKSRNRSSHTYDENTANELVQTIIVRYSMLFTTFNARMQALIDDKQK